MSKPTDLVQGTLDLLLLKILALQPLNGFSISQRLKQVSRDVLQVSDGSLYPALHKLEHQGWIKAEWKLTNNNRRAKFYSLTRLGRRQLEKEAQNWKRLAAAISYVLGKQGECIGESWPPSVEKPLRPRPACIFFGHNSDKPGYLPSSL